MAALFEIRGRKRVLVENPIASVGLRVTGAQEHATVENFSNTPIQLRGGNVIPANKSGVVFPGETFWMGEKVLIIS